MLVVETVYFCDWISCVGLAYTMVKEHDKNINNNTLPSRQAKLPVLINS